MDVCHKEGMDASFVFAFVFRALPLAFLRLFCLLASSPPLKSKLKSAPHLRFVSPSLSQIDNSGWEFLSSKILGPISTILFAASD